jgi:hypothetical protein
VCPQAFHCPKSCCVPDGLHRILGTNGHTLQHRRPFSTLDTAHHFTASTRIPILSP